MQPKSKNSVNNGSEVIVESGAEMGPKKQILDMQDTNLKIALKVNISISNKFAILEDIETDKPTPHQHQLLQK